MAVLSLVSKKKTWSRVFFIWKTGAATIRPTKASLGGDVELSKSIRSAGEAF